MEASYNETMLFPQHNSIIFVLLLSCYNVIPNTISQGLQHKSQFLNQAIVVVHPVKSQPECFHDVRSVVES